MHPLIKIVENIQKSQVQNLSEYQKIYDYAQTLKNKEAVEFKEYIELHTLLTLFFNREQTYWGQSLTELNESLNR